MRRNGNINSNRIFNPRNVKPSIPLDIDEVDSALERFIRQKYDQQMFSGGASQAARRNDTGSTRSSDDQPPPLPPKTGKRFGFGLRSVSSALSLSKPTPISPPRSPEGPHNYRSPSSPIRVNKQSRVFGATVGGAGENLESKLATLKDMGFPDDKRNLNVLKGVGGDIERAIETLVRLGEGSAPTSRSRTPMQGRNVAVSQPLPSTRQQSGFGTSSHTPAAGSPVAVEPTSREQPTSQIISRPKEQIFAPTDPFQPLSHSSIPSKQPQSQPQTASLPIEQAFENMQVSQPLFPHATGGYPSQHQQLQEARFQQSMTPPVPQLWHQLNPYVQHSQTLNGNYNPFFQTTQVPSTPQSPYFDTMQQQSFVTTQNPQIYPSYPLPPPANQLPVHGYPSNPFGNHPQQQYQQPGFSQAQTPSPGFPALNSSAAPTYSQTINVPYTFQPLQPLQPQPTGRFDKASILALYNYPHLAPAPPTQANDTSDNGNATSEPPSAPLDDIPPRPAQRSVTMPIQLVSGSKNPFHSSATANTPAVPSPLANGIGVSRHISHESADIGVFPNGRHSPDAFASLSARSVR